MPQHFLLSSKAKTLTLASVFRMSDSEAEATFRKVRWTQTEGAPVCPECGGLDAYECRRPNGALRFRCKACKADFSITSGTLFASHKLPLRGYAAQSFRIRIVMTKSAAIAPAMHSADHLSVARSFSLSILVLGGAVPPGQECAPRAFRLVYTGNYAVREIKSRKP